FASQFQLIALCVKVTTWPVVIFLQVTCFCPASPVTIAPTGPVVVRPPAVGILTPAASSKKIRCTAKALGWADLVTVNVNEVPATDELAKLNTWLTPSEGTTNPVVTSPEGPNTVPIGVVPAL